MATLVKRKPKAKEMKIVPALRDYFRAKLAAELGPHDLKHLLDAGNREVVVLDVRSKEGYRKAHVPGAVHIPFEELSRRAGELDRSKEYISYCWNETCFLAARACYYLASQGFVARELVGGIGAWTAASFPTEK